MRRYFFLVIGISLGAALLVAAILTKPNEIEIIKYNDKLVATESYAACSLRNPASKICDNLQCLDTEEKRQAYDVWKNTIKSKFNLNEKFFNSHFFVDEITTYSVEDSIAATVDYYFKLDWVRLYDKSVFVISKNSRYTHDLYLDDKNFNINENRLLSKDVVSEKMSENYDGIPVEYDFCSISFDNSQFNSLPLVIKGYVHKEQNYCVEIILNLFTGAKEVKKTECK